MGEARRVANEELRSKDFGAGLDEMVAHQPSTLVVAQNVLSDVPMLHLVVVRISALNRPAEKPSLPFKTKNS
jgi:hypothetical protein